MYFGRIAEIDISGIFEIGKIFRINVPAGGLIIGACKALKINCLVIDRYECYLKVCLEIGSYLADTAQTSARETAGGFVCIEKSGNAVLNEDFHIFLCLLVDFISWYL